MVFRALIVFSYGYNEETRKIIEVTFLTFVPYARFFASQK